MPIFRALLPGRSENGRVGLIPSLDVAYAEYARYIMNGMMTQLARIEPGKNVEEAHMRNRKLIAEWCYEQGRPTT